MPLPVGGRLCLLAILTSARMPSRNIRHLPADTVGHGLCAPAVHTHARKHAITDTKTAHAWALGQVHLIAQQAGRHLDYQFF